MMDYEYGMTITISSGRDWSTKAVILSGKPTLIDRVKLAWRVLIGK